MTAEKVLDRLSRRHRREVVLGEGELDELRMESQVRRSETITFLDRVEPKARRLHLVVSACRCYPLDEHRTYLNAASGLIYDLTAHRQKYEPPDAA